MCPGFIALPSRIAYTAAAPPPLRRSRWAFRGGDMRVLVPVIMRLLRAPAGGPQQPPPPLTAPELLPPRDVPDETQVDVPVDGEDPEEGASRGFSRGIGVAAATFVPTFLATYFGIVSLAGVPMGTRSPAVPTGGPPPVMSTLAPQRDLVASPRQAQAPIQEALKNAAAPATTSAIPRPAPRTTRPHVEPKAAQPKRPASAAPKNSAWVRGAAFPDRDSAERLAASIESRGYSVTVRRDDRSSASWVVWINKNPRMTPSEPRE